MNTTSIRNQHDRGVRLDMDLVKESHQALMDTRSRSELTAAMKDMTALTIKLRPAKCRQWLSDPTGSS